ncbi:MAG: hypothetical protein CM15mP102_21400 [Flavobacteriales bacterium]|nr:MAG: hypothetical protein CM15mP102_21400 [Flavobacteriales bacterium]
MDHGMYKFKYWKTVNFKQYCVWNFNEDGKVHSVTEYLDLGGLLATFNE